MTTESRAVRGVAPAEVHEVLRKWMLVDGFDLVYDPAASRGAYLVDARNGDRHLDLFSFFASMPLGHNHPGMGDPAFRERLLEAALSKVTNSDIYTEAMARFVATFGTTIPSGFRHLFFVEGGALAVENALKAAFDWKVRKNQAAGRSESLGTQVIHFEHAFHGRSGYTLSLTNSFDPNKTRYFPKFDWPRVATPGIAFPLTADRLAAVEEAEQSSLAAIRSAIAAHPHDIAAIIIETIQGEGGDVHFRPEFLRALRQICDDDEIILIFDEVQTGFGITGEWWAFEHLGVQPDIFSFGKKTQVCGIAATARLDEVDSVFAVSSRINSTWGGGLVDMVRCQRYVEIIQDEELLENAAQVGSYLLERLQALEEEHATVSNARGRGLMCAFDLPDPTTRAALQERLHHERILILPCGARSLRFRPTLDFEREHVDEAVAAIDRGLRGIST